jgi:hypothetical protein
MPQICRCHHRQPTRKTTTGSHLTRPLTHQYPFSQLAVIHHLQGTRTSLARCTKATLTVGQTVTCLWSVTTGQIRLPQLHTEGTRQHRTRRVTGCKIMQVLQDSEVKTMPGKKTVSHINEQTLTEKQSLATWSRL